MQPCFAAPSALLRPHARRPLTCSRPARLPPRHRLRPRCNAGSPPPGKPTDEGAGDSGASDEHDIPQSAVDWNSEWSKFTESGMRSMAPRGREPVSKEEVAAARAMSKVRAITDKVPSRQQLFRDWRFWLAIIASLSLFSAFVQSVQNAGGGPYGTI